MFPKIWENIDTFQFLFGATAEEVYHSIDVDDNGAIDMRSVRSASGERC